MDKEVLSIVREYKKELEARGLRVKKIFAFWILCKRRGRKR